MGVHQGRRLFRYLTSDWYGKLAFLFSAILLWQWFDSLEGYWWPQTFAIVHGLLIAGVLIEWLFPGSRRLHLALHVLAVTVLTMIHSNFVWLDTPDGLRPLQPWGDWFAALISPLDPYIWISLPVLLLFLFAGSFCRTRYQVILMTGASVLSLSILDSFTEIYFWDEVAWSVFVALAWLAAEHFYRFQKKHPETWGHMLEYPVNFAVPVVLVLVVVMASGLFVPNIQPILKDPYTMWMESRGQSVPSFVGNKLESTSAEGLSRDSRSGYSREDGELGGGFQFDYSEVMTVSTTRRSYWRGETKSVYTGMGWNDSSAERREPALSGIAAGEPLPSVLDKTNVETEEVRQTITMIRKDPYPVLFGAATIRSVAAIGGPDSGGGIPSSLAWLQDSGELRWPQSGRTPYPEVYSIVSEAPVLDETKLRQSKPVTDEAMLAAYTQLPDTVTKRMRDLAKELTSGQASEYDKVRAIESYLKQNFPYTNTPDLSKRKSADFVDSFLFEVKEGYCDYYSTALAVLARLSGIPARWVKGYAPGILPLDNFIGRGMPEETGDPNGGGTYTVRNADAHSWVEVYFEGYGWMEFEATAGFSFPYSMPAEAPAAPETAPEAAEPKPELAPEKRGFSIPLSWSIGALAALLAAAAYFARSAAAGMWSKLRFGTLNGNQRIVLETEKLVRYCKKRGLERFDHETLRESVHRWADIRRSLRDDFMHVLNVFERAKYSASQATSEEAERLAVKIKSIRERL
ncbi:transglutaminase domain-containing protein, partial [Paenibacillus darwinianus]|uniref:transglutaminase domain-containing protein n=1 Tax=Paenibacillus darwinianus TaxID=1380763 RepID=UPI0004489CD8